MTDTLKAMLARVGKRPHEYTAGPRKVFSKHGVTNSGELRRIAALPRRDWGGQDYEDLTPLLKTHAGTMQLRPVQNAALHELYTMRGLLAPIRVGGGKTLISLLAPEVMEAERPVLVVPAKLVRKTQDEAKSLEAHFSFPHILIMSYEKLGREQYAKWLEQQEPDLIIADECHKLKNPKAAVTRRFIRYMLANPSTVFCGMSGTVTKRSLRDYAHLAEWALGDGSPLPLKWPILEEWCDALDERVDGLRRLGPGALECLYDNSERLQARSDALGTARRTFRRRMVETPGIVTTEESPIDASLTVEALHDDYPRVSVLAAFKTLREFWETPDGWPISDAATLWRHARELACGFYYVWDPRPPQGWLEARKDWCRWVRWILSNNRRQLDSELQVTNAVKAGHYTQAAEALHRWESVRDTFEPRTRPEWLDSGLVRHACKWFKRDDGQGIIWVEHVAFGKALEALTGPGTYYGAQGLNSRGEPIEAATGPVIASVAANSEGRNLQHHSRNLVISCAPNGALWEQLLGRTHRDGQEADEVTVDAYCGCLEMWTGFEQARADARYIEDSTGQPQKLNVADILWPSPEEVNRWGRSSPAWSSSYKT
jgi:hypothetical protein